MAVKIRLRRMGSKKNPFYRIVVADSRSPRDGRIIEELGYYNPVTDPTTFTVDNEKATYWISQGAKPTDTIDRLFNSFHVYDGKAETVEVTVDEAAAKENEKDEKIVEERVEKREEKAEESEEETTETESEEN